MAERRGEFKTILEHPLVSSEEGRVWNIPDVAKGEIEQDGRFYPPELTDSQGRIWVRDTSFDTATICYAPQGQRVYDYHITFPNEQPPGMLTLHETRQEEHGLEAVFEAEEESHSLIGRQGKSSKNMRDLVINLTQYQNSRFRDLIESQRTKKVSENTKLIKRKLVETDSKLNKQLENVKKNYVSPFPSLPNSLNVSVENLQSALFQYKNLITEEDKIEYTVAAEKAIEFKNKIETELKDYGVSVKLFSSLSDTNSRKIRVESSDKKAIEQVKAVLKKLEEESVLKREAPKL